MALRVCYIAGREAEYSRTRIIGSALKRAGFEVVTCLPPNKSLHHYPGLVWKFVKQGRRCDVVVVGFYGQLLLLAIRMFTRKPILYDIYISTYDTMVYDRQKTKEGTFMAWLFRFVDRLSMRMSDRIVLETRDHIRDYSQKFGIPENKFAHIFLAADESVIHPKTQKRKNQRFLVHFHGEYAPFHGVRYILEAAHLLADQKIDFQIIGTGITYWQDRTLAERLGLNCVRFIDWIPYDELRDTMAKADCCLGIFGDNPRTLRVLTNKVVETLAVGKPLISARNQPIQELVKDGESALLVERANPEALAHAILRLRDDPKFCQRIGEKGHEIFLKHCTIEVFSQYLKSVVEGMVAA